MNIQQPESLIALIDLLVKQGIPKTEHWRYVGRFLELKCRKRHIPVHGIFELTPLCNFNCRMCYVHLNNDQFANQTMLPVQKWKQLADSARNAGLLTVALTGGECLTYPGFDELYMYLVKSGLRVTIMTNGYYVDKKIDLFKEYKPAGIQVSIYGSSDDAYEKVTGVRAFNRVVENINIIRDSAIKLKLAITPSIYMRDDLESLIRFVDGLHVRYGVNPLLMLPREETGRTIKDLSLNEYLNIYRLLSSIHHEDLKRVDWSDVPKENHGGAQRYGLRCAAGRSSFGIKYEGSMCPCLSLDTIIARPLEIGFNEAWERICKSSEEYALPLECGDCIYSKHCLSCVAIHNGAPVLGHCNPEVCERMKRLVHEGFVPLKNIC